MQKEEGKPTRKREAYGKHRSSDNLRQAPTEPRAHPSRRGGTARHERQYRRQALDELAEHVDALVHRRVEIRIGAEGGREA